MGLLLDWHPGDSLLIDNVFETLAETLHGPLRDIRSNEGLRKGRERSFLERVLPSISFTHCADPRIVRDLFRGEF